LGGANYFWGPVLGTVIAVWLDVLISQVTERYSFVIGVIFLLIVLFSPNGILGFVDSVRKGQKLKFLKNFFSADKRTSQP
jgi:ABC-type branched-subunit amino acid transport system permease subunit